MYSVSVLHGFGPLDHYFYQFEKQILTSEVTCVIKGSHGVRSQIGQPQEAKEASQEDSSEYFCRSKTGHRKLFQHVKVNDVMRDQGQMPVSQMDLRNNLNLG